MDTHIKTKSIDKAVISDNIKNLIEAEKTKTNTITVLIVQPAHEPYTKETGADFKSLQFTYSHAGKH